MEDRRTVVISLDNHHIDIVIQPKLMTYELLQLVASRYLLKEKHLFGLAFKDNSGQHMWLQDDRRILEHELPRNQDPLMLHFLVRFYVESIVFLEDIKTIEMFYLQAQLSISQEHYSCNCQTVFQLAAYVLQEVCGDYIDDSTTRNELRKLPVIPTSTLKEYPSIAYCEDKIIALYKQLSGLGRGYAIVNYMNIVESLPVYGVHFYDVKDKAGLPWWLGLSVKGISLYDHNDRKTPRKEFPWKQLENIYFRDKKFSVQVHDSSNKRSSGKLLSRRHTLSGGVSGSGATGGLTVHSWFAASPLLTKCVWSTAVAQHQFYIDTKHTNTLTMVRSMSDIADILSSNGGSLSCASETGSLHSSSASLPPSSCSSKPELSVDNTDSQSNYSDMYTALLERRQILEQQLGRKLQQLRRVCLEEAELTGTLPPEYPATPGESVPRLRRRVGTSFSLSPKLVHQHGLSKEAAELAQMEVEVELQEKITAAALRLAQDQSCGRSIRKKRVQSFHRASDKLKQMQQKLRDSQAQAEIVADVKARSSVEDLSEDSGEFIDSHETDTFARSRPHRSASDDQLLSHSGAFTSIVRDSSAPSLHCDSDDIENLMKSDQVSREQEQWRRPTCSHDVPENCSSSCWTFANYDGDEARQCLATDDDSDKADSCSSMTQPFPIAKSKSSELCSADDHSQCHQAPASQSTCFYPASCDCAQTHGYVPSSVYKTRTQYRMQRYPTFSLHGHQPRGSLDRGIPLKNVNPPCCSELASHCDKDCTYQANTSHTSTAVSSGDGAYQLSDGVPIMPYTASSYVEVLATDSRSHFVDDQSQYISSHAATSRLVSESRGHTLSSNFYSVSIHHSVRSRQTMPASASVNSCHVPSRPSAVTTVTSHSMTSVQQQHNVVHISKPFESSDVLRYSEKLRRERVSNSAMPPHGCL